MFGQFGALGSLFGADPAAYDPNAPQPAAMPALPGSDLPAAAPAAPMPPPRPTFMGAGAPGPNLPTMAGGGTGPDMPGATATDPGAMPGQGGQPGQPQKSIMPNVNWDQISRLGLLTSANPSTPQAPHMSLGGGGGGPSNFDMRGLMGLLAQRGGR